MRTWCEWWHDTGKNTPCCQRATEDEIEADPARYECSTCQLRQRYEELWPENREAWDLWGRLASRVVVDLHLGPWILDAVLDRPSVDDTLMILDKLDLIRDTLEPQANG